MTGYEIKEYIGYIKSIEENDKLIKNNMMGKINRTD
jgi:hypothetical protein